MQLKHHYILKNVILLIMAFASVISYAKEYKYELAICTVFRNEAKYLQEWIEFHLLQGANCFLLYNNFSTDNYKEILMPYIKKNIVHLKEWPVPNNPHPIWQISAVNDGIATAKQMNIKWVALIDVDEFLFSPLMTLPQYLKSFENFGGLCVNWQMFGSSHIKKLAANKLVTEEFVFKAPKNYYSNLHVKSIVRPERIKEIKCIHYAEYIKPYGQVDCKKRPFHGAFSKDVNIDEIRINHYWSKDEETFSKKIEQKRKNYPGKNELIEHLQRQFSELNEEKDSTIHKYISKLKQNIQTNEK